LRIRPQGRAVDRCYATCGQSAAWMCNSTVNFFTSPPESVSPDVSTSRPDQGQRFHCCGAASYLFFERLSIGRARCVEHARHIVPNEWRAFRVVQLLRFTCRLTCSIGIKLAMSSSFRFGIYESLAYFRRLRSRLDFCDKALADVLIDGANYFLT
jgi:hypothetical protein